MKRQSSAVTLSYRLAYRNLLRNKRRSLVTLVAIIFGIGITLALVSFARGAGDQFVQIAIHNLTGHLQIRAPGYRDDPVIDYRFRWPDPNLESYLENLPESNWAPRVRVPGIISTERESRPVTIVGIDPIRERGLSVAGETALYGEQLQNEGDMRLMVGDRNLEKLQTSLERRAVVMSQSVDNEVADRGFVIGGTFTATLESTELNYVFTGIETLQMMLGADDEISEISILLEDDALLNELYADLQEKFPDYEITTWMDLEPMASAVTEMQNAFLIIWFSIIVFAVSIGVMNTMFMAIYERIKEIALMKAIGTPGIVLFFQVTLESFFLLLIGAVLGTIAGYTGFSLIKSGVDISVFAAGVELFGLSRVIYPQLYMADVIMLNGILFLLGILGTLYPAWYASSREPLQELQK